MDIDTKYEIDSETIKQKIEREHNKRGYWTYQHGIHDGEDASILVKWQDKYCKPTPKKLKECPFCKQAAKKWKHYTECDKMPREISDLRKLHMNFKASKQIKLRTCDIMLDINLEKI